MKSKSNKDSRWIEVRGNCHDCGVEPGTAHQDGCDTARCTACGHQRISCEHYNQDVGWGEIWTGIWPGSIEEAMYGLDSLNDVTRDAQWSKRHQLWLRQKKPNHNIGG